MSLQVCPYKAFASGKRDADKRKGEELDKSDPIAVLAATGDFDIRGAIGQHFARAHAKGSATGTAYRALSGHAAKKAFRQGWAESKYEEVLKTKRYGQDFAYVDETKGEYLSFGAVVTKLGGWEWPPALLGAKNLAARCLRLQGRWVVRDSFSGLLLFLYLNKSFTELYTQKWSEYEEYFTRQGPSNSVALPQASSGAEQAGAAQVALPAPQASSSVALPAPQASSGARGKAKAKAKGKSKANKATGEDDTPTKDDTSLANLLKEALKLKAAILKAKAAADALVERIESGSGSYSWAHNEQNLGALKTSVACLFTGSGGLTEFGRDFLLTEAKAMREQSGQRWGADLEDFVAVRPRLEEISELTRKILKRSRA